MAFEYQEKILALINKAIETNKDKIEFMANKFAEAIENDKLIHTFGTGHSHMVGIEMFARAGGLGNVDAILDPDQLTSFGAQRSCAIERVCGVSDVIYDSYKIEAGDIMLIISNSGRNPMPIEMAMRCKKEGVFVLALTNLKQSQETTSRHPSGKKLYEVADCVIDTCVPDGDSLVDVDGIKTGPGSSVVGMSIMDTICSETIKLVVAHGKRPYVFQSQNVDGYDNDAIYNHFYGRIKNF